MSRFEPEARTLNVLLDIRQPQAYLALHPAATLATECGVPIDFLPVVDSALKAPSEPAPDDDRGIRHRRYRAQAVAREIETYASSQGLVLREYYRDADPSIFNVAWLWVRQHEPARLLPFLTESFRRYWAVDLDPSSEDAVAALLESLDAAGPDFRAWRQGEGRRAAGELADALRERGLQRAPTYLVEGEVFIGRQHLPMIRWILEGRPGRGPI